MSKEEFIEEVLALGEVVTETDKEQQQFDREVRYLAAKHLHVRWAEGFRVMVLAVNALWRPLGALAMTAFGAYCHLHGVEMIESAHLLFDGAFPAWGASRHVIKNKEASK